MSQVVVGIADFQISSNPEDVIVTHALGSCIAVAIHDPVAKVGGMLHLMLPDSTLDKEKAQLNPSMFADTGLPLLFRTAYTRGAEKRRLTVYLAGGAQVMDDQGVFNIGKRNYLAVKKILWKAGVLVHGESVGGNRSRTVRLDLRSGSFLLREGGREEPVLPSRSGVSPANGLSGTAKGTPTCV
jgi:chemotaxis protein CheD